MIAVDTNILVYAHREDSPHHVAAGNALAGLVEAGRTWGIPWPCLHEFLAIVTHPRIYDPPSSLEQALAAIADLDRLPKLAMLGEGRGHVARLADLLVGARVVGPRVHEARIAAICLAHGVDELWTADRDFGAFPQLSTRNPLGDIVES